jgi:hypothetical protein
MNKVLISPRSSVSEVQLRVKCCSKGQIDQQSARFSSGDGAKIESRLLLDYWPNGPRAIDLGVAVSASRPRGFSVVVTSFAECWLTEATISRPTLGTRAEIKRKMGRRNPINAALTTFYERPKGGEREKIKVLAD